MPVYGLAIKYTDNEIIAGGMAGLSASATQYMFDFMKIKKQTYQKYSMKEILYNKRKVCYSFERNIRVFNIF